MILDAILSIEKSFPGSAGAASSTDSDMDRDEGNTDSNASGIDASSPFLPNPHFSRPYNSVDTYMSQIEDAVERIIADNGGVHASIAELWYWLSRIVTLTSILVMLVFLFYHDY